MLTSNLNFIFYCLGLVLVSDVCFSTKASFVLTLPLKPGEIMNRTLNPLPNQAVSSDFNGSFTLTRACFIQDWCFTSYCSVTTKGYQKSLAQNSSKNCNALREQQQVLNSSYLLKNNQGVLRKLQLQFTQESEKVTVVQRSLFTNIFHFYLRMLSRSSL